MMKYILFTIVITIVTCKLHAQINISLTQQLAEMKKADQECRQNYRKFSTGEIDSISLDNITSKIKNIASLHYPKLQKIFDEHRFPGFDKVGRAGAHDFWVLVQHQDKHPTFQDSVLKYMHLSVLNKNASAMDYAYLQDRVLINTGKKQRYGTQLVFNKDTKSYELKPVENHKKLNELRKEMRLPSIEFYISSMNKRNLTKS